MLGTGTVAARPTGDHIVVCRTARAVRAAQAGATSLRHTSIDMGQFGTAVAGRYPDAALRGLQNNPGVRYIAPDASMYAVSQTTPWGVSAVRAPDAWTTTTGTGAHVAVLDTGIDTDHLDLPAVGESRDFTGGGSIEDVDGHGSHVAGTVAAVDDTDGVVGVAHGATLHVGKVLGDDGSGSFSDLMDAIAWVKSAGWGPSVINMSLGANLRGGRYRDLISALNESTRSAYTDGVLLVAAAGNDGGDADAHYPSACPDVMAVSATDSNDDIAWFSNYGDTVELAAPGVDVRSTTPGDTYSPYSGTSMASPHVAAVGALVMATGLDNAATRQRLHDTARDLGASGWDQYYGYGLVDAAAAVAGGDTGDPEDTTAPTADAGPDQTVVEGDAVTVDGSASTDNVGIVSYAWALGDGTTAGGVTATHTYAAAGSYTVTLTVADGAGNTDTDTLVVTVEEATAGENTAPTVDTATYTEETKGRWVHYVVDWTVSDPDSDLATVTVTAGGASDTQDASGSTTTGSSRLKSATTGETPTITVTDAAGNVTGPVDATQV